MKFLISSESWVTLQMGFVILVMKLSMVIRSLYMATRINSYIYTELKIYD